NAAALVHRLMTILLLRAAERVWVSIPEWERCWRSYTLGRKVPFGWGPIPSNIPVANSPDRTEAGRRRGAPQWGFAVCPLRNPRVAGGFCPGAYIVRHGGQSGQPHVADGDWKRRLPGAVDPGNAFACPVGSGHRCARGGRSLLPRGCVRSTHPAVSRWREQSP